MLVHAAGRRPRLSPSRKERRHEDALVHDPRPRRRHRPRHRRLAVRLVVARRAREGRRRQGVPRPGPARDASRRTRRSPTTRSRASTTRAWPPASPASSGRWSCSRSATASPLVRAPREPRRHEPSPCNATGVAGDPASPVHRLDPRAKIDRARRDHARRRLDAAARRGPCSSPARVALAAIAADGSRAARASIWSARAGRAPARGLRRRLRAVRARRASGSTSGRCRCPRTGWPRSRSVASKADDRHGQRGPARRDDELPGRPARRSSGCARRACSSLIAAFMYRYLFVIADEARRMRVALAARGYRPRHALPGGRDRPRGHRALPAHLRARRARVRGDARARLRGAMPRLGALAFRRADARVPRRARRRAAAAARARECGMSCAIDARGLRYRYPNGVAGLDGVDLRVGARRARRRARAQRRRQDDADAPPQRAAERRGRARGGRASTSAAATCASCARASGSCSRTPTTSCSCRPSREDVAFGPLNLGARRAEASDARGARRSATVRMEHVADRAPHQLSLGQRRRVAIATVLAMRPAAARARRAVGEPRPARAARAARGARHGSTGRCSSSPTTCRSPPSCASAR